MCSDRARVLSISVRNSSPAPRPRFKGNDLANLDEALVKIEAWLATELLPEAQGAALFVRGTLTNGIIPVDDYQNTRASGIYAISDITGKFPLTAVAIASGRKLAERLFNGKIESKMDQDNFPSIVFSHPPIGTVGITEAGTCKQYGNNVTIYRSKFTPMRHALSSQGSTTAMNLVCAGNNKRVVGNHIIGDNADEMTQGFAIAMKMGATKAGFDSTIAFHSTGAEELVTMKVPS